MKRDSKNPYPNLKVLIKYHPYHIGTFANFANVELDLLEAALIGEEELTARELMGISCYGRVPFGVLASPSIVMLDPLSLKHKRMLAGMQDALARIEAAVEDGSRAAADFMYTYPSLYCNEVSSLCEDFSLGRPVTYCRYLGVRARIEQCLGSIAIERMERRKRGRGSR